jgi:hypothetical protein
MLGMWEEHGGHLRPARGHTQVGKGRANVSPLEVLYFFDDSLSA